MKTFEDYQKEMNPCYKNYEAFLKGVGICYIPENAESLSEAYTYSDLKKEAEEWKKDNENYFIEHKTTLEIVLANMFDCLSWEFPYTYLDSGLNY